MSFIPEPHNGDEELRARADGQFSTVDCFQWPQLYCDQYHYAVCIRHKESYPSPNPLSWAWYRPTIEDFETLPHAAFEVGKLKLNKAVGVTSLHQVTSDHYKIWKDMCGDKQDIASRMLKSLEHDVMVLLNHPLTFRDITVFVAQAQWYCLDILAFLDYVMYVQPHTSYPSGPPLPVQPIWMGCFMQDTKICDDLYHAGVPVWLIHFPHMITSQTNIEKSVKFTFPDAITHSMYSEGGKPVRPFDCLYRGPGRFNCHLHTRHTYTGSGDPRPSGTQQSAPQVSLQVGKAPTQAQSQRAAQKEHARPQAGTHSASGGHNKWEELRLPEMPLSLNIWENAMKCVDKDPFRVKKGLVDQGCRVPEPALLISGQTPERRQLFMMNWLAIHPLWISRLDHDPPARFPSPQQWREILHCVPSRKELEAVPTSSMGNGSAKGRKLAVLETFGEVVAAMTQGSCFTPKEDVEWHGKHIPIASLTNPPPRLIKAILWEIYEIGWQYV